MFSIADENRKSRGLTPETPESEHRYRHKVARESLRSHDLDAILFFGSGSGTADQIRYLADYVHIIPRAHSFLSISRSEDPILLIDRPWYLDNAQEMSHIDDIRTFPQGSMQMSYDEVVNCLDKLLDDAGAKSGRVGIFDSFLPSRYFRAIQEVAPDTEFVSGDQVWYDLVTTPSEYGKKTMRQAAEIADEGLQTAISQSQHGVSEQEVCLAAMSRMASLGAEFHMSFPTTVPLIGSNSDVISNLRSFVFTNNRLEHGQMFWYDQITAYKGYYIDCDRTICVGEPSEKQLDIYQTVRRMYEAMLNALSPGTTADELWDIGVKIAAESGYEDNVNFIHHGHTIGPAVVGQSMAAPGAETKVRPESFVNIEPGIFVPGVGSACIENTVYVTENSAEPINSTDIGLQIV